MKATLVPFFSSAILCAACAPHFSVEPSRATQTRVVAVRATPAEARPGASVVLDAVVIAASGAVSDANIDWVTCFAPRSPSDPISVSSTCLATTDDAPDGGPPRLVSLDGSGHSEVTMTVPSDACQRVGPQIPPADANGNRQRPPDPDITGGYQLPIRLTLADDSGTDLSFARLRLRCNLVAAPAAIARDFDRRYTLNENPNITEVDVSGTPAPLDGTSAVMVSTGAALQVSVAWEATSREPYVLVDPVTRAIAERNEALEVAWYTNGGVFAQPRTVTTPTDLTSANVLRLDHDRTDPVTLWLVLRDDRGGIDFKVVTLVPGA